MANYGTQNIIRWWIKMTHDRHMQSSKSDKSTSVNIAFYLYTMTVFSVIMKYPHNFPLFSLNNRYFYFCSTGSCIMSIGRKIDDAGGTYAST